MSNVTLELSAIRLDGGTQPRFELNQDVIEEYAEAMKAGAIFPPVTVFYDGTFYWLADGFHRFEAAKKTGALRIAADLKQGTQREAILHSVGVNASHGLRRTSADKRRAVETLLHDPEWRNWSDSAIAKTCQVDNKTVARIRYDLGIPKSTSRKATNGRVINVANIGKRTKGSDSLSQPSTPNSTTQPESSESLSPNLPEEEGVDLMESTLITAKPYVAGDHIRILRRQNGADKWSGKVAKIMEVTPDGRLRVDVAEAQGVRFTLNPEWVESMSEIPESYKVQPEQASIPQGADEPDPESPAMADAASGEPPLSQSPLQLQAGDRLRLANLKQSGQQWVGEVADVIEVAEDRVQVVIEIPRQLD